MTDSLKRIKDLGELSKLEATPASVLQPASVDAVVTAIVRVSEPDYVPSQVRVRARIDQTLFTGEFPQTLLRTLEADSKVQSVALSRPLHQIGKVHKALP